MIQTNGQIIDLFPTFIKPVQAAGKKESKVSPGEVASSIVDEIAEFIKFHGGSKPVYKEGEPLLKGVKIKLAKASFLIANIDVDKGANTAKAVVRSNGVPYTIAKSYSEEIGSIRVSDRLTVDIARALSYGRKRSFKMSFAYTLDENDTVALCGNTDAENYKIALAFSSLVDSQLSEMSPYFSADTISTRDKSQKVNITVRVASGQLLLLPDTDFRHSIDKSMKAAYKPETFSFEIPEGEDIAAIPKDIVYWNLTEGMLTYISTDGKLRGLPLDKYTLVAENNALSIITSELGSIVYRFGRDIASVFDSIFLYTFGDNLEIYPEAYKTANDGWVLRHTRTLEEIASGLYRAYGEDGIKHIKKCIKFMYEDSEGMTELAHPLRKYSLIAAFELLRDYYDKIDDLKEAVQNRIAVIDGRTASDAPALPSNLSKDLQFYPYQAEAYARSAVAGPTAIFDVATGGGKTILGICDALYQIGQGGAKKPLFVMPPNLASQWFDEVQDFSDGDINVVTISTETVNKWGLDALTKVIKTAPKNTFFLTTYNWLILGCSSQKVGNRTIYEFPNVNFLISLELNKYVLLDEAHFIKNVESKAHMACVQLGAASDIKRLATGTLMPNLPTDIVGQMEFLDPTVFGSTQDFVREYAEETSSSGRVISWKPEAYEQIRDKLKASGALTYTRKDWFYLLPKLIENFYTVTLNKEQQKVYEAIVKATMDDIKGDPILGPMWEKAQNADDVDEATFGPLLARLKRIERFASAPEADELSEIYLDDDDLISPKLATVDELISKHLGKTPDEKILLLTQSVDVAHHFMNYSKYKDVMMFYRGGMKENLIRFQKDPSIKILCGVDQSLKFGLNLQIASRMIRLDVHWAQGDLDQVLARIYRPTKEKDTREFVYMDWVIADNTIDILKIRRIVRKMVVTAKMVGIIEPTEIPDRILLAVNETNISTGNSWIYAEKDEVVDYKRYRDLEGEKWEILREEMPTEPIPAKFTDAIPGKKIDTPWPKGISIPVEGTLSFDEALQQLVKNDFKELVGYKAITEFGPGFITSVSKTKKGYSVRIRMEDGRKLAFKDSLVGVLPEKVKDKKIKKQKEVYKIDKPGTIIRIGTREFLLTKEGELHKVRNGKIIKLSYTLTGDDWLTPKGRVAKIITPNVQKSLLKELIKMDYVPLAPKAPKVTKTPKVTEPKPAKVTKTPKVTEPKPAKVTEPKVIKPKPEVLVKQNASVKVRAINISGVTGLLVRYAKKYKPDVKKVIKGLRMSDMPYYRLAMTNTNTPRVIRAIKGGKLKPKNKKSLLEMLTQFKQAKYKMKNIDEDIVKDMRKLMVKNMKSPNFYMFPVLVGSRLEAWVPASRPEAFRKYLSKMQQLGFKERVAYLRLFIQKAGIKPVATQLVKNIKKNKVILDNIEQFKEDLKKVQLTVKK